MLKRTDSILKRMVAKDGVRVEVIAPLYNPQVEDMEDDLKAADEATDHRSRKEEIIDCAANAFFKKGFHASTIEDIASEVGMLKGSLYYYIESKDNLLYEILQSVIEQADAAVKKALDGVSDPKEKLKRALEQHIEVIIRNQVRVGLFLHEFHALSEQRRKRIQKARAAYQNVFVGILVQGQLSGDFSAGDPHLLANGMIGMCNWIYRWYRPDDSPDLEKVQEVFIGMIMFGVLKCA